MDKKIVAFASDHAAVDLKNKLVAYIEELGYQAVDLGPVDESQKVSYSLQGHKLAKYVKENDVNFGIGLCGTGLGISYALNRHNGIRAARVASVEDAELAKLHNNANILVFGGRQVSFEQAKTMVDKYIATNYEGGRHQQRIDDIEHFED
ncbi:ribose 5 phosphate isomerase [Mycoplasmopsis californica HAZ160_1]|uniref:Ribose 5 phosphate isomerase n=1 Tax=Mycoplasmopsis californica HAZ160_1 TaxID=1397850 RepID=A0AAT9F7E4_9BACT|nr:RpiB/LacA/LacB family sugar-phosphate isomerase [Mycoplasmopsis californica]BAP00828.1 ribose 5 phosphate isomerase [Mycoplasmopsis californica HAZ160_1]BBG40684.1 ribose 5 phosphate isomerase [Mycoplasmopsis californica]BBG41279.1 ribose 5 phosphate isomerase [Mycoplasmopsis californica]BBG41872.1 ribose 5 phosphate isomerase [Mycoplasmopsis californica]BBG42464.1 ribose 5 phosphate isomerase [Mycoplasmopsis californica]